MSPLFLKIGTKILHLHSSDIFFEFRILLNNLLNHATHISPKHFHTLIGEPYVQSIHEIQFPEEYEMFTLTEFQFLV